MTRFARPHGGADDTSYRWWALAATSLGTLLASLASGTLIIALPDILRDLNADLFGLLWIVVGYTLVVTVLVLNAGRVADLVGRERVFIAGFAVFTAFSIACALAGDTTLLIAMRVGQGIGGAMMLACSPAIVTDVFPRRELGRALGINAMVVGAGMILGPVLGGWLTGYGWRMVFWFNVPLGIAGTLFAAWVLIQRRGRVAHLHIDWPGTGLYLVGLLGLMTALAFGGIYGWTTWWIAAGLLAFVVTVPLLIVVERRTAEPLLDLSLFRDRLFALGNLTALLNGIARNSVVFLLVFYLQGAKGIDPVTAGLMLAPLAVGLVVLSPISGALSDRFGSRGLATLGMLVTAVGLAGMATLALATPYWQIAGWLLVIGAGSGIFTSPNTSAVMGVLPPEKRGIGAGMRMMVLQSSFVISIALALGLVTTAMDPQVLVAVFSGTQTGTAGIDMGPFIAALRAAFAAGAAISLVGAGVSWMRGPQRSAEAVPVVVNAAVNVSVTTEGG